MVKEKSHCDKIHHINKLSAIINILLFIIIFMAYFYIMSEYIAVLEKIQEPVLLLIGILSFMYISLPRLFNITGNLLSDIKYDIKTK
jgi:hypothetical protein